MISAWRPTRLMPLAASHRSTSAPIAALRAAAGSDTPQLFLRRSGCNKAKPQAAVPSPWGLELLVSRGAPTFFLLFICCVFSTHARAASSAPAANTPLIAEPPAPALPRIVDTFDKQPIRRAAPPSRGPAQADTTDTSTTTLELPRLLAAMALVVGLIFMMRWFGRRFFGATPISGGTRAVQVLSRSLVAPRQSVMLMQVGRRLLIVSDNGSQLAPLSEISDPDEVAALVGQLRGEKLDVAGRTFSAMLGRIRKDEVVEPLAVEAPIEASPISESSAAHDPDVSGARAELSGLMEQVRLVSSQFSRT